MRLTKAQKAFLETIPTLLEFGRAGYWECFPSEVRTARSLAAKGLIEFEDGVMPKAGDYFMARQKVAE